MNANSIPFNKPYVTGRKLWYITQAHMYYVVFPNLETRARVIAQLTAAGINAVFHYVSLHDSPYGRKIGRLAAELSITRMASDCLLRLPLWLGVEAHQQKVVDELFACVA